MTMSKEEVAQGLERSRLTRLFHSLDTNQDGKIDPQELTDGLKRLGYGYVTEEQIEVGRRSMLIRGSSDGPFFRQHFLRESDVTKSGDLNIDEFVNYLTEHEKNLHLVFTTLDENKDGWNLSSKL
jgi:Ca2+-binding EF-hand superfamily protein